jgi:hypothetical protein
MNEYLRTFCERYTLANLGKEYDKCQNKVHETPKVTIAFHHMFVRIGDGHTKGLS